MLTYVLLSTYQVRRAEGNIWTLKAALPTSHMPLSAHTQRGSRASNQHDHNFIEPRWKTRQISSLASFNSSNIWLFSYRVISLATQCTLAMQQNTSSHLITQSSWSTPHHIVLRTTLSFHLSTLDGIPCHTGHRSAQTPVPPSTLTSPRP